MAILQLLQSFAKLNQYAGGGAPLDAVGLATAWHRWARHAHASQSILLGRGVFARKYGVTFGRRCCGLARPKRSQRNHNTFKGRALASLAWALAKLSVAPQQSAQPLLVQVPLPRSTLDSSPTKSPNHTELASRKTLLDVAATVRQIVLDVARGRANGGTPQRSPRWIPAWSQLAGHLLDTVAELVWYLVPSRLKLQCS
jgi:hypothetical protein